MNLVLATDDTGGPEIFASLQGEGPSAGKPCSFIRLSRCNLACVWCDTAYTWRFAGDNRPHRDGVAYDRKANQVSLSPLEAARAIDRLAPRRLVITGGEPLLQAAALAEMALLLPDHAIEVETNGTVEPSAKFDAFVEQYTVSPKLAHSGNPADLALPPERLAAWAADTRAWFKFVIAAPEDVAEVRALCDVHHIPAYRVFLMPEGTDSATLRAREQWLAPLCVEHGYRLSDRLHIHLYGDTRGT
ncbi:7-carboxy-7-deazaguanine synthase [Tsuneonella dongtanensis]|uniref:7-carboxy-7-deazaguanine synthase n=1 Tax=Tsuneonella dongtanensis TaxID=692370 RepID=A0A1B2ACS1_9SPHN|nr:7-carboxy-7-deazaguanine synthase QueE [Tsuneonella dongtanensis]ANY19924.1 7-carboxy-7-deazaguanine synthase [Tsuneonella dongtanensis]